MHDGSREDESTGRTAGRVEGEARRVCDYEMGRAGRRMGRELGLLCALGSGHGSGNGSGRENGQGNGQENVMGVYGFIETPVEVLVVCEYVGGETLVERLEKYGADFSEGKAAEITRFVVILPIYLLFSLCDILTGITASRVVIIIITDYYYFCLFLFLGK